MARVEIARACLPSLGGLAPIAAGAVVPSVVGALSPSHGWVAAAAAVAFAVAGAGFAFLLRETEQGLRYVMSFVAGASLALFVQVARGAALWPPHSPEDRAALCTLASVVASAVPVLQFEYQRLEWWYVASALVGTLAVVAVIASIAMPVLGPLY